MEITFEVPVLAKAGSTTRTPRKNTPSQYLIEEGLALVLEGHPHPSNGYKLASDWAQNYDSRYGNGFNGPSSARLLALAEWIEENEK